MGRESTRNAPGTRAVSKAVIASSDAAKNLSLSDSTFNPYATDKVNEPVRLPGQIASVEPETTERYEAHVQMHVLQKALGRFGESAK
jgi:hypothetical protein